MNLSFPSSMGGAPHQLSFGIRVGNCKGFVPALISFLGGFINICSARDGFVNGTQENQ